MTPSPDTASCAEPTQTRCPPSSADTGSTDTQHTDQNVVAETTYVYAVQALSPDGDSAQSQTATAITSAPPTPTAEPTTEPPPPPASDEVTGLALSSETAGELVITWNTPTDEPTDYRISWAPADEEYLPFSEENNTTARQLVPWRRHNDPDPERPAGGPLLQGHHPGPLRRRQRSLDRRGDPNHPGRRASEQQPAGRTHGTADPGHGCGSYPGMGRPSRRHHHRL